MKLTAIIMTCRYCLARPGAACVHSRRQTVLLDEHNNLRFHPHRVRDANAATKLLRRKARKS